MMRFYKQQHQFYCGVDLHAKAGNFLSYARLVSAPTNRLASR